MSECVFDFSCFLQDYPTISQLVDTLSDNNIQTIFAVTQEFRDLYQVCAICVLYPLHIVTTSCSSSHNISIR